MTLERFHYCLIVPRNLQSGHWISRVEAEIVIWKTLEQFGHLIFTSLVEEEDFTESFTGEGVFLRSFGKVLVIFRLGFFRILGCSADGTTEGCGEQFKDSSGNFVETTSSTSSDSSKSFNGIPLISFTEEETSV